MRERTKDARLCCDADIIQRSRKKAGRVLRLQWYLSVKAKMVFSKWRGKGGGIRVWGNGKYLRELL